MQELISGEKDPIHGKIVKTVAVQCEEYYVFIDTNNEIFYAVFGHNFKYPENFNKLNSKIRRLEVLVLFNLDKRNQANYNYLLANNIGEALDEPNIDGVWEELKNIENDINVIVNNEQKKSFTYGTNVSLLLILICVAVLFCNKNYFTKNLGLNAYQICLGSLFGGVGALIFNYSKSKKYQVSRIIGQYYNFLEGGLRIFYGVIYALIIILGIKSGIILSFINGNSNSLSLICFIGILAGASDTFIVGILKSLEKKSTDEEN